MKADDGLLTGLKVIDCATDVAGPAAATILSDFGADVVKAERRDRRTSRKLTSDSSRQPSYGRLQMSPSGGHSLLGGARC
jgi:crotonobetainyl-CoA:carnitine CoA-transferase CaiB-like acyl-CoA transferase